MESLKLKVLCFGDVVGRPGRGALKNALQTLKHKHNPNLVVANGENSAGGTGMDIGCAKELLSFGVDVITLGDHVWQKKELRGYLAVEENLKSCIRPANYPDGAPGRGWTICKDKDGNQIGVMNLMGRVFMNFPLDCPFKKAEEILTKHLSSCKVIICDFHGEATSEKIAFSRLFDGRVSLIFGTHTHVQTADNCVLSGGSGYITDVGMCGCIDGVIGMSKEVALQRFLTGMPVPYEIADGVAAVSGVVAAIDAQTGKAISVERFWQIVPNH